MEIKVINKSNNEMPIYATPLSSGIDLRAYIYNSEVKGENSEYDYSNNTIIIHSQGRALIHTGLYFDLEEAGLEAQIRPRSGLALKNGITVLNTPGTIDAK